MAYEMGPGEYHGRIESRRVFDGFEAATTCRPKGTQVGPHSHRRHSFIALLEGSHCWTGEDGSIRWSIPDVWHFRPAGYVHTHAQCPTDIRSVGFHFEPHLLPPTSKPLAPMQFDGPAARRLSEATVSALTHPGEAADLWLQAAFFELAGHFVAAALAGPAVSIPAWLEAARIELEANFRGEIGLTRLAVLIGVHPSHLAREFRRRFGISIGGYVRDRRLEWAYRRLKETESKVAVLAAEAGFADHAHFCRLFKSRYGQTPSQIRTRSIG